jgi:hypothetical protein
VKDEICRPGSRRNDENVEKLRILLHPDGRLGIKAVTVRLNLDKETVVCVEKGMILGTNHTAPAHKVLFSQAVGGARNQLQKLNTYHIRLIWLRMTSGCF